VFHGKGELVTKEYKIVGTFNNGETTGNEFDVTFLNETITYTGGMKHGKRHGYGVHKTIDHEMSGTWEFDRLHGDDCKIVYLD